MKDWRLLLELEVPRGDPRRNVEHFFQTNNKLNEGVDPWTDYIIRTQNPGVVIILRLHSTVLWCESSILTAFAFFLVHIVPVMEVF